MIFADILPGLDALFARMSGLVATSFDGSSPVFADDVNEATLQVKLLGSQRLGQDEDRSAYDPAAVIPGDTFSGPGSPLGGFVPTFVGQRTLRVQITVECEFQDLGHTAWRYTERCRDRLPLPSSKQALSSLGLALAHLSETRNLDYIDTEGRQVSVASFDVDFNAAATTLDDPITTIETVDLRADHA